MANYMAEWNTQQALPESFLALHLGGSNPWYACSTNLRQRAERSLAT